MTTKGITTEITDKSSAIAVKRLQYVDKLIEWLMELGFTSKDVKLVVGKSGDVKCLAKRYIPTDTNIFLSSTSFRLTFATLRHEVLSSKQNTTLNHFVMKIKAYECNFKWNQNNYLRKVQFTDIYFSDMLPFVICIFASLKKIERIVGINDSNIESLSPVLKTFHMFWNALPSDINNVLYGWNDEENEYLKNTSLYKCLEDSRRYGHEVFEDLLKPFILTNKDIFGEEMLEFQDFIRICSIVISRTFGENENQEFIPIIDLVNGKPSNKHNCVLDRICLHGVITRTIRTVAPIYAGEEIFLEYPQYSNSHYLLVYNCLPFDRDVIMNNILTEISFDMINFFDSMLVHIHPNSEKIRDAKKAYISEIMGVPRHLVFNTEDLSNPQLNIAESMRQVLMFLQSDEHILRKTVETKKLRYSVPAHVIFHSFFCLIESQYGRPNLSLFNQLLTDQTNSNINGSNGSNGCTNNMINSKNGSDTNSKYNDHDTKGLSVAASDNHHNGANGESSSSICSEKTISNNSNGFSTESNICNLTDNMKYAIYLQMSERATVDNFINSFIELFDEIQLPTALSIMASHLVNDELSQLIAELEKPCQLSRSQMCMMCGLTDGIVRCSRCHQAFYCGTQCQQSHWNNGHKKLCKKVAAPSL